MRRPLGCLTFSALVAAILVVFAIIGAAAITGNGIFSPGQLSAVAHGGPLGGATSHADLQGRCDACHAAVLSNVKMGDLCLVCHAQVKQEIASKGGLHGRLLATPATCRDCHTEHRGATAAVTLADPRVFPHEQTGYTLAAHPLKGQGGGFGCRDCHPGSPLSFTAPTCASCHQTLDAPFMASHVEAFGSTCLNCHDGVDTYGKSFKHATYPLEGGHAQATCVGCHRGSTTLVALRATSTVCATCHAAKDIHEGRLGTNCAECHSVKTWADATIDHSRTRFALVGKHASALCETCHVDRHWTGIGTTCRSCHAKDDTHAGQFPGDCASCHTASGWKPATFDHATTRFALKGGHAKAACVACHANGKYVGTPRTCVACHAANDKHNGTLGKDCAACHKVTTWTDVSFNHDKAAFPLTGAHQSVTCLKCHVGGVFKGTPKTCAACHSKPSSHGAAYAGACSSCHSTKAWKPAAFNHNKAAFPLTGAHVGVTCQKCHVGNVFKGTPKTCAACHTKPASHDAAYAGACSSCHSTKAWKPASFNHSKTAFPLTGAHLRVTCQKCHVGGVLKGTPKTCAACHTKPASHTASFGINCASCHSTKAWKPASYNGPHTFPRTHGGAGGTCAKCHPSSYASYTCASCHKNMSSHQGGNMTTCAKCHPTGRAGD
jgi:hypothetical protein